MQNTNYTKKVYTIQELKRLLTPVFKQYPVYKAILYGSYARGEATPESDIDIVIDSRNELKGFRFAGVMGHAEEVVNKFVQIYEEKKLPQNSVVINGIKKDGVLLYER